MTKFEEFYKKIAIGKNYLAPNYPRMDNWAVDRYECGTWFAGMSDAGYSKWVGKFDINGKVLWKVADYYPNPLEYSGITEEEFNVLEIE